MGFLQPDPAHPGLYLANPSMTRTSSGNFTIGDGELLPSGNVLYSVRDMYGPVLTYLPPLGGYGPRVEVFIPDVPFPRADVWREVDGHRSLVRGGVNLSTLGGLVVVDAEVPFGRPVTYQAVSPEGVRADASTITLDRALLGDDYTTWVHNVLEPSGAMPWIFTGDALGQLTTLNAGESYVPEGGSDLFWMGSGESGLRALNLSGSTYTLEDARRFGVMFGTPDTRKVPILVFRGPPELLIPGTLFALITERSRVPHNVASGITEWVEWRMVGDETAPPFPGLAEPVVTWDDVAVRFPTEDDYAAAYQTEVELSRDYSLAGLANNN